MESNEKSLESNEKSREIIQSTCGRIASEFSQFLLAWLQQGYNVFQQKRVHSYNLQIK